MFAQRGEVMDVQKQDDLIKEAFEIEAEEIGFCLDQLWGDYENPYENSDTALAFNLFKKGWLAKAQAVPEGFVLVPKVPSEEILPLNSLYEILDCQECCDAGGFCQERYIQIIEGISKAMIEAQELSHD